MRFYYTDPLKASFMVRDYGISLVAFDFDGEVYSGDMWNSIAGDDLSWNFFVQSKSYEVLELQVGDFASVERKHRRGNKAYNGFVTSISGIAIGINGKLIDVSEVWKVVIIQRGGKAFFMPEVES